MGLVQSPAFFFAYISIVLITKFTDNRESLVAFCPSVADLSSSDPPRILPRQTKSSLYTPESLPQLLFFNPPLPAAQFSFFDHRANKQNTPG